MNKILKYFLYFLFGFIIYLILNNKVIEGFENELSLIFSILKERQDIGCNNYTCKDDPYEVNHYSQWESKIKYEDENSLLCNNSHEYSIVSTLNTGNKCNNELCCDDNSCQKKFFSQDYSCFDRIKLPGKKCPMGIEGDDCFIYCCDEKITGTSQYIFNNVLEFRNKILENTIREDWRVGGSGASRCGNKNEFDDIEPFINENNITGLDLRNYIYFSLLDLDNMRTINDASLYSLQDIGTIHHLLSYHDFECIHNYLKILYDEIFSDAGEAPLREHISGKLIHSGIFTNNERLKIKEELLDDKTVSQYVNQLEPSDSHTLYSETLKGGIVSNKTIQVNFLNFIKFYTNDDDTITDSQHNTHDDLIKDFKLAILMIANSDDDNKTPLDILFNTENYKTIQIDPLELKVLL